MYELRPHQQRAVDKLHEYWFSHRDRNPILVQPTGAGKSIVIAELCRLLFDTYPDEHPRTLVLVPSKELAEQNGEKIAAMLPYPLTLGYYSASLGKKDHEADVIVATIGSIYRDAHILGNIRCVVIDECHLVNPNGSEAGRYRQLLSELNRYTQFRIVGLTATPFRGNGIWLTEGDDPLFNGVADTCTIPELISAGFLSPMTLPKNEIETRIDVSDIGISNGDYKIGELSDRTAQYLVAAADETIELAVNRSKWIAFTPTVANAEQFADLLRERGISCAVVTGKTPKKERAAFIALFRQGGIRCLITVLALSTGFDVPDVDCVIWLRTTRSQVLYVQGAGRGLRIAEGKTDCLWLDFTDTTERLGPIDTIKGRKKPVKKDSDEGALTKTCDNCGELVHISLMECPSCGYQFPIEEKEAREASNAAVMASMIERKINEYDVTRVHYSVHKKPGKPDSIKINYMSGLRVVASEWVCAWHDGFAGTKGKLWWDRHAGVSIAPDAETAVPWLNKGNAIEPVTITVDETGKYSNIIKRGYHEKINRVSAGFLN